jgi:transposase-like protein
MMTNSREERGKEIASLEDQIKRIDTTHYAVKSQSNHGEYDVIQTEFGWTCSCPDHEFRQAKCKHIYAVEFSFAIRKEVEATIVIQPTNALACLRCGSDRIVKNALRHNKYGDIQRYACKECGKRFSFNVGFEKMKANPQVITSAMQLYFTGESLRNVQKFMRLQGVNVSHVSVYNWIRKYVGLMEKYLDRITPNVSDTWRADELFIKIKGDMKYLFALMDDETRYWIAQEVADTKEKHDARRLFHEGKEITGKKPMTIITDGLKGYHRAYMKEFWTQKYPRTKHIKNITLKGEHNNNKMERLNGEIRDREKVMRGLKEKDTPIITGYQIFHNYIRQHEGLKGKTPAEVCGIKVEGKNKWITLIQNASKSRITSI